MCFDNFLEFCIICFLCSVWIGDLGDFLIGVVLGYLVYALWFGCGFGLYW